MDAYSTPSPVQGRNRLPSRRGSAVEPPVGRIAHDATATLSDLAWGVDAYSGLGWLLGPHVNVSEAVCGWLEGKVVQVPSGHGFDAVERERTPGWDALRQLRAMRAVVGPILHTTAGVMALVPTRSITQGELPRARLLDVDEPLALPHPSVVAPHTVHARTWIVAPRGAAVLTDAADLCGAYTAALLSVDAVLRESGDGPRR